MPRVAVKRVFGCGLDDFSQIHHGNVICYVAHHCQVMTDKEVGKGKLGLEIGEQIDDLRLNGHVKRGDRLVANNQAGIECQRTGNSDALTLTAGEFVGNSVRQDPC